MALLRALATSPAPRRLAHLRVELLALAAAGGSLSAMLLR